MTPNNKNIFIVELVITEFDIDPDKLTHELNVRPSYVQRTTDLTESGKLKAFPTNAWILESGLNDELTLEKHIDFLLNKIGMKLITGATPHAKVRIDCYFKIFDGDFKPNLSLSSEIIHRLNAYGCGVYHDYYIKVGSK